MLAIWAQWAEEDDLEHLSDLPVPTLKYLFWITSLWCGLCSAVNKLTASGVLGKHSIIWSTSPAHKKIVNVFLSILGFLFNPSKYFNTIRSFMVARPYTTDCSQYIQTANSHWIKPLFEASSCLTQRICFHAILCGQCGLLWSSSTNYKKFIIYYKKSMILQDSESVEIK